MSAAEGLVQASVAPTKYERLFVLVDDAVALLDEERDVFLEGQYMRIAQITERKLELLGDLETELAGAGRSVLVVNAVKRLIALSRRNEQIIQAARQGLAHARRRIVAIREAGQGVVAYAEDGSRIASTADLSNRERSA